MKKNIRKMAEKILKLEIQAEEETNIQTKQEIKKEIEKTSAYIACLGIEAINDVDNYVFPKMMEYLKNKKEGKKHNED